MKIIIKIKGRGNKKSMEKKEKKFEECAFCGNPTRYYFEEIESYICIECLARYKIARMLSLENREISPEEAKKALINMGILEKDEEIK